MCTIVDPSVKAATMPVGGEQVRSELHRLVESDSVCSVLESGVAAR